MIRKEDEDIYCYVCGTELVDCDGDACDYCLFCCDDESPPPLNCSAHDENCQCQADWSPR